jgi:hypothetical protein
MLELSTVAVDILVDQRAIAASNMLVRRTSKIRAVNTAYAKSISLKDSPVGLRLGSDRITMRQSVDGAREKGYPADRQTAPL